MKRIKLNCWILVFLCFFSCSEKEVFSEFYSVENGSWDREKPAVFEINVNDTLSRYNLDLVVRNNDDYPFRNLWLFIDRENPDGTMVSDSLNIELADVYGKWYGKGMSLYSLSVSCGSDLQFPHSGNYVYNIRQGMRENPVKGISDIGLIFSKKTAQ
jgi:gliding motility-associated lipoprotein GldH